MDTMASFVWLVDMCPVGILNSQNLTKNQKLRAQHLFIITIVRKQAYSIIQKRNQSTTMSLSELVFAAMGEAVQGASGKALKRKFKVKTYLQHVCCCLPKRTLCSSSRKQWTFFFELLDLQNHLLHSLYHSPSNSLQCKREV